MVEDFCAFILTHGRPDNVITYRMLEKCGYTGPVYIVIDNEDKTADRYREIYGDKVVMFDKAAIAKTFDEADNFDDRRAIVYARNACFEIARELGFTYFIQLDDDYTRFGYRYDDNGVLKAHDVVSLDGILEKVINYYKSIPALAIAFAQDGDFIGGTSNGFMTSLRRRKCMNSFICSTDRPFQFVGRINEDVNTYTCVQSRGHVFMTIPQISIRQVTTQQNAGGMSDIYLDKGTYVKSFYSVMFSPSCVKIAGMGSGHRRLHHQIAWKNAVPQIIREAHRKPNPIPDSE